MSTDTVQITPPSYLGCVTAIGGELIYCCTPDGVQWSCFKTLAFKFDRAADAMVAAEALAKRLNGSASVEMIPPPVMI